MASPPPGRLSRDALAAVDWYKPRRFASHSDGEDDLPSPHSREPPEMACQSSSHVECKGSISCGYGDKQGFLNSTAWQSSSYGDGIQSCTTNKEAKVKVNVNRRRDHTSLVPQQNSAPLWLNACPPFKHGGRNNPNRSAMLGNKKTPTAFDPREPCSPEVSCLGRVRTKENHSQNTDHPFAEEDDEGKKQSADSSHASEEMKQSCKLRGKVETAEKGGCLARRKRRAAMSAVTVSDGAETRRERAAALARSLTSLLEDLRKLEMEKEGYEPAVPPPNSLLLMRGLGGANKVRVPEVTMICDGADSIPNERDHGSDCENAFNRDLCLHGMKAKVERTVSSEQFTHMNLQRGHESAQQVLPLSEIKSNSLAQNSLLSEPKSKVPAVDHCRPQELSLWQRRAITKLDDIDTRTHTKLAGNRPSTK